ncbi:MAG TPA: condensation domain-containing protein, partial [Vicinamibacterales bacterium]|nr:condensation domain-containing protein [Vicinamibacterales bacterium]
MSRSDGIGERLDALSPERRALLEALRAEGRPSATGIRRRDPGEPVTLSFAQRRLWFLDQLASGNPFYNIPLAVRLPAPLSAPLLERSINEIVCRHESLRTTFESRDGEPLAVVAPALHVPLSTVNLRSLPAESREAESVRLATLEAQQPFDLERGPLIRTTLLELTDFEQVFLLSLHHIIGDGWSAGIFFQELSAIYPAFAIGRVSPLPELPLQYGDFAVWQKRWLSPDVLREQLGYWKQQLAELPTLNLATDRPRPPLKAFRGAVHRFTVDVPLTREIKALSRRESVTLFMTLLAAFQILLHRYTSQSDVVVGSMISNRTRRELEPLIGFFVNSLVLRTDLSGDPTF